MPVTQRVVKMKIAFDVKCKLVRAVIAFKRGMLIVVADKLNDVFINII